MKLTRPYYMVFLFEMISPLPRIPMFFGSYGVKASWGLKPPIKRCQDPASLLGSDGDDFNIVYWVKTTRKAFISPSSKILTWFDPEISPLIFEDLTARNVSCSLQRLTNISFKFQALRLTKRESIHPSTRPLLIEF